MKLGRKNVILQSNIQWLVYKKSNERIEKVGLPTI